MASQASFLVAQAARVAVSLSPEQFTELRDKCHRSVTFLILTLFEFIMHPRRPLDRYLRNGIRVDVVAVVCPHREDRAGNLMMLCHDAVYWGM